MPRRSRASVRIAGSVNRHRSTRKLRKPHVGMETEAHRYSFIVICNEHRFQGHRVRRRASRSFPADAGRGNRQKVASRPVEPRRQALLRRIGHVPVSIDHGRRGSAGRCHRDAAAATMHRARRSVRPRDSEIRRGGSPMGAGAGFRPFFRSPRRPRGLQRAAGSSTPRCRSEAPSIRSAGKNSASSSPATSVRADGSSGPLRDAGLARS